MKGEERGGGWTAETHTATPPAYSYTAIQRITVEVDNTTLAEYFIHADLEPGGNTVGLNNNSWAQHTKDTVPGCKRGT